MRQHIHNQVKPTTSEVRAFASNNYGALKFIVIATQEITGLGFDARLVCYGISAQSFQSMKAGPLTNKNCNTKLPPALTQSKFAPS